MPVGFLFAHWPPRDRTLGGRQLGPEIKVRRPGGR